jgi:crotonobetainyl-CoA:carnitine CoA-transferase CaiB-like acyl-CoA transferase
MKSLQALHGIRVLDVTRVLAGPWCSQILADLGAQVYKIERPKVGDDSRTWGPPFLKDKTGQDTRDSAYYLSANRNKQSVTCDISKPAGQAVIKDLAKHCDIFMENFKVGDMSRYGLDFPSLASINPRLVYCSITGFGQTGPHKYAPGARAPPRPG